jgi:hypothetical protein
MTVDQLGLFQPGTDSYDENRGRAKSKNECRMFVRNVKERLANR